MRVEVLLVDSTGNSIMESTGQWETDKLTKKQRNGQSNQFYKMLWKSICKGFYEDFTLF